MLWLALAATPQAQAAGPLLVRHSCFNPHPSEHYTALSNAGIWRLLPLTFLSRPADIGAAQRLRQLALVTDAYSEFAADFRRATGRSITPPTGGRRLEVYVTTPAELHLDGLETTVCGTERPVMLAVSNRLGGDANYAAFLLAHEIFHAFQSGPPGGSVHPGWWVEATASFAGGTVLGASTEALEPAFLQHPELPLDHVSAVHRAHQYGAFRFVEWLHNHMSDTSFWRMLVDTFRHLGPRTRASQTTVLRSAERAAGRSLGADLGRFWADHLQATTDNGPAAPSIPLVATSGTHSFQRHLAPLSARLFRITAASGVARVRVQITPTGAHHVLWVDAGSLSAAPSGYDREFCVGRTAPGLGRWPGELRVANTNTDDRHPGEVTVELTGEAAGPCQPTTCPTGVTAARRSQPLAETCTPPPPPAVPCTARDGYFDSSSESLVPPDRVYFDVFCVQGRGTFLNSFGGAIACPAGSTSSINLSPSGGGRYVGKYLDASGTTSFAYTLGSASISVSLQAQGSTGTSTITITTPSCSRTATVASLWRNP